MCLEPQQDKNVRNRQDADFETAIAATGFGKFNVILILLLIPAGWTSALQTTSMSYVFPAAQCDLNLSVHDKGMLNAATYIGMASSALIWGFLADILGRRRLLIAGYFLDGIFTLISGFSQTYTALVVSKFFGGFIINGPFATVAAYLSEMHCAKYRSRILMLRGILVCTANVLLPFIAWLVFPLGINLVIIDNSFVIRSWNVFLLILACPSLISTISFFVLPESPKFLMSNGENERALEVFQLIYSINYGKPKNEYPIKRLLCEKEEHADTEQERQNPKKPIRYIFNEGFKHLKPLVLAPYRCQIILVCTITFGVVLGVNTIKLWLPQIFTAISNYQLHHNGSTSSLCVMLNLVDASIERNGTIVCDVDMSGSFVYINSIIVASTSIAGFCIIGCLINRIEKRKLFVFLMMSAAVFISSIYFSQDAQTTTALAAMFISQTTVALSIIIAVVVDLFPTNIRTTTVATTMMFGRCGAVFGNLLFPLLLQTGCMPTFLFFGFFMACCALLAMFLPNTHLKALE